ncbi:ComEC/Rec2 family competence protein [Cognatishimia sp. WU-CL00825]|uniref:ComEC/Rec2 family competence protein n=1 Tax=Cognatishimia sp. WU-CL00825 TaxID=3127658 RepID=UPI0031028627
MQIFTRIEQALLAQRGHLFLWVPISFGIGIGIYFAVSFEPAPKHHITLVLIAIVLLALRKRLPLGTASVLMAGLVMISGIFWADLRAHLSAAPRLEYRYYGPIQGRVIKIDRSSSSALRLTLDQVILSKMPPDKTPKRVRVSLHGPQDWYRPEPFQWVGMTGHLGPPNGPVEPGGFDFQRHAWFLKLGGLGYTRVPALELRGPPKNLRVLTIRHRLSRSVQSRLDADIGGFAAAVTTGDRSGISQTALKSLRTTNLAHLLAISGLHMGLLASFVFATIRCGFVILPSVALRLPVKKIAAALALVGATGYLLLSGASVATERAYVMAAVALVAVMLERRALSLRAVAMAAMIVLILRPESLFSPGFQMSFAATTALIAVFSALRGRFENAGGRWGRTLLALCVSSFVAGAATAPFAAAHFNQWALYGLPANLLAVPMMGFVVIPAAVLAACLAPLGLEHWGLIIMGWGLEWILGVADFFAGLQGARRAVPTPPSAVLPLISLGSLVLILWRGKLRVSGALPVFLGLWLWFHADRPDVLIAETGGLVGVLSGQGRILSQPKGQGFVAQNWLENDGDDVLQSNAANRGGLRSKNGLFAVDFAGGTLWHIRGKRAAAEFIGCQPQDILVTQQPLKMAPKCLVFDAKKLRTTGALAIRDTAKGVTITSVLDLRGNRPWSSPKQTDKSASDPPQ